MPNLSTYSINQLETSLRVIRSQNIKGESQKFGSIIEKEIESREDPEYGDEFVKLMKRKMSQTSIGASALRNQGAKGLIKISRYYFENEIILEEFKENLYSNSYIQYLDNKTDDLLKLFPEKGKSWGAARKGLNLFFRDVIYNYYLRQQLNINDNSHVHLQNLEVPLDKDVASGLKNNNSNLDKWVSIKSLTKQISDKYQNAAKEIADKKGILRIHLDLEYWRQIK
jgi:hypothetical protein